MDYGLKLLYGLACIDIATGKGKEPIAEYEWEGKGESRIVAFIEAAQIADDFQEILKIKDDLVKTNFIDIEFDGKWRIYNINKEGIEKVERCIPHDILNLLEEIYQKAVINELREVI